MELPTPYPHPYVFRFLFFHGNMPLSGTLNKKILCVSLLNVEKMTLLPLKIWSTHFCLANLCDLDHPCRTLVQTLPSMPLCTFISIVICTRCNVLWLSLFVRKCNMVIFFFFTFNVLLYTDKIQIFINI